MPVTIEDAFARVKQLAEDFKANEKFYLSQQYQEAEARRDFIDKFLVALGWDVNHDTQKNPYEQEVKVERKERRHRFPFVGSSVEDLFHGLVFHLVLVGR